MKKALVYLYIAIGCMLVSGGSFAFLFGADKVVPFIFGAGFLLAAVVFTIMAIYRAIRLEGTLNPSESKNDALKPH